VRQRESAKRARAEAAERTRIAREAAADRARLQHERIERERLENERLENERLERERLERERLENERLERERLERERLENERLENERLERERLEREREAAERARLAREAARSARRPPLAIAAFPTLSPSPPAPIVCDPSLSDDESGRSRLSASADRRRSLEASSLLSTLRGTVASLTSERDLLLPSPRPLVSHASTSTSLCGADIDQHLSLWRAREESARAAAADLSCDAEAAAAAADLSCDAEAAAAASRGRRTGADGFERALLRRGRERLRRLAELEHRETSDVGSGRRIGASEERLRRAEEVLARKRRQFAEARLREIAQRVRELRVVRCKLERRKEKWWTLLRIPKEMVGSVEFFSAANAGKRGELSRKLQKLDAKQIRIGQIAGELESYSELLAALITEHVANWKGG
jgi:hypothetical protein